MARPIIKLIQYILSTISEKIVETLYLNRVLRRANESAPLPCPLHMVARTRAQHCTEGMGEETKRVRRILLTCIQLLLIQFLDVIWSMPKNFAFFQKPLAKFFYKFDNPEINRQEIFPASFKNIENKEGFQIGPQI